MFDEDRDSESSSQSTGTGSSGSAGALPETPAVRRRDRTSLPQGLRAHSDPLLTLPPMLSQASRGGSAAGNLGGQKKEDKESPSSSLSDESQISLSGTSIKISFPLHQNLGDIPEESPSTGFMPPHGFGLGDQVTFASPLPVVQTPPPHITLTPTWKPPVEPEEEGPPEVVSLYSPHPNSIAMTTRDLPPKGWYISTEAGIVLGSAAAYHGSSVRKVSTRAMTLVVTTLNEARNVATQNMLKAASHRGCNAILGVKYDSSSPVPEISLVTAYGTACVIAREPSRPNNSSAQ